MADFRVTDKDRYEFNAWIKGRMKDEPRLKQYFKDEDEYEEFMLTYEQTHINLDNDPAVIQKQYSETPGNVVECSWDEGVYNGKYYDFLFIRDDGEQLRFQNPEYGDDEFPAIVTVVGGKAYLAKLNTGFFSEILNEYMIKYKFKNERDEWSEDFQIYIGSSEKEVRELFNKDWVAGDKPLDKLGEVSISVLRENVSNKMFSDKDNKEFLSEKSFSLRSYQDYINENIQEYSNKCDALYKKITSLELDLSNAKAKYKLAQKLWGLMRDYYSWKWILTDEGKEDTNPKILDKEIEKSKFNIERLEKEIAQVKSEMKSFSDRQKVSAADLEKAKSEGVVQKKPNGKWGIISIDAEEWWNADYNTKESAENALKAYHANKSFSTVYKVQWRWKNGHTNSWDEDSKTFKTKEEARQYIKDQRAKYNTTTEDAKARVVERTFSDTKDYYVVGYLIHPNGDKEVYSAIQPQDHEPTKEEVLKFEATGCDIRNMKVYKSEEAADAYAEALSDRLREEQTERPYDGWRGYSIIDFGDESGNPGTNAWYYIGQVLDSIEFMHKVHLITTDYAAHKALNSYYDDMPELIDKFAEDLLSQVPANAEYRVELFGDHSFIKTQCPIEYLETLMEYEKSLRLKYKGFTPAQLSELDAVSSLIEGTLYKLKRLAVIKNRKFIIK